MTRWYRCQRQPQQPTARAGLLQHTPDQWQPLYRNPSPPTPPHQSETNRSTGDHHNDGAEGDQEGQNTNSSGDSHRCKWPHFGPQSPGGKSSEPPQMVAKKGNRGRGGRGGGKGSRGHGGRSNTDPACQPTEQRRTRGSGAPCESWPHLPV